jgi:hypothetical protein
VHYAAHNRKRHHPVAVKGNIVGESRRELVIRSDAIERPVDRSRDRADNVQAIDVGLDPTGCIEAREPRRFEPRWIGAAWKLLG